MVFFTKKIEKKKAFRLIKDKSYNNLGNVLITNPEQQNTTLENNDISLGRVLIS